MELELKPDRQKSQSKTEESAAAGGKRGADSRIQVSCGSLPYTLPECASIEETLRGEQPWPAWKLSRAEKRRIYTSGGEEYAKIKKRGRRWYWHHVILTRSQEPIPPFPLPPLSRAVGGNGGDRKRSGRQLGVGGRREREREGSASGGSRQEEQEVEGEIERKGKRKRRRGIRFVQ